MSAWNPLPPKRPLAIRYIIVLTIAAVLALLLAPMLVYL